MHDSMTSYHARRHPFIAATFLLILGPYLLAAALVVGILYTLASVAALAIYKRRR